MQSTSPPNVPPELLAEGLAGEDVTRWYRMFRLIDATQQAKVFANAPLYRVLEVRVYKSKEQAQAFHEFVVAEVSGPDQFRRHYLLQRYPGKDQNDRVSEPVLPRPLTRKEFSQRIICEAATIIPSVDPSGLSRTYPAHDKATVLPDGWPEVGTTDSKIRHLQTITFRNLPLAHLVFAAMACTQTVDYSVSIGNCYWFGLTVVALLTRSGNIVSSPGEYIPSVATTGPSVIIIQRGVGKYGSLPVVGQSEQLVKAARKYYHEMLRIFYVRSSFRLCIEHLSYFLFYLFPFPPRTLTYGR